MTKRRRRIVSKTSRKKGKAKIKRTRRKTRKSHKTASSRFPHRPIFKSKQVNFFFKNG